ncbi:MAG: Zn-dependent alcohol dehydrogenase [Dehalococcoidales bacterium]|nr:MAG: Zn-dependent alcohol dehydrogenase [Dehalococcoidales bacterium]
MKAAVCYEFGQPLVVEEVDLDSPKEGEVKVRMGATAICHSDIHLIRGEFGARLPVLAGHESAGYVEEVGENVTLVKSGDTVVVSLLTSCGRCPQCVSGRPYMCQFRWPLNRESRIHNRQGQDISHMTRTATFAEYAIVHESQAVPIPEDMPIDRAALLACGVITGFGAAVHTAQVKALSSTVVIGCGGVGLNAVQGAAMSGAYPLIAVDMLDNKLEAARTFGATHTVKASDEDAVQTVRQLTGRGADYVLVTVGNTAAIQQGFDMSGPHSMIVVAGLPPVMESITLPSVLRWQERMVTTSTMGSTLLSVEIPKLVALYQAGRLKLDELITSRYSLDQINEAIEVVEKGEALRNVIVF